MTSIFMLASALAIIFLTGCFPVGNYHSARPLKSGQTAIGLTFSTTTYTTVDEELVDEDGMPVEDRYTIPGIIPEFTYHIGITDDFEFGGRLVPGFLFGELDAKYRFLNKNRVHLTIAPAVGQMILVLDVTTVRLPLLFAYELHPRFALTAGANVSLFFVQDSAADWDDPFTENELITTTGFSVGIDVVTGIGIFRPSFELSRAFIGGDPTIEDGSPLQIGTIVVHFASVRSDLMEPIPPATSPDQQQEPLADAQSALSWQNRFIPASTQ